ncbi:MAG: hypothetical protein JF607_05595 [Burkholderiales bacterium]|nr:hypothetical protein [Burkholderiales bacterium]
MLSNAEPLRDPFIDRETLDAWLARAGRAAKGGDFGEIERLLKVLSRPFDEPLLPSDAALPPDWPKASKSPAHHDRQA